jgi:hypothetical protein
LRGPLGTGGDRFLAPLGDGVLAIGRGPASADLIRSVAQLGAALEIEPVTVRGCAI